MIQKTKQEDLTLRDTDEIIDEINAQDQLTGAPLFDRVYRIATFRCERQGKPDVIVEMRYAGDTAKNYQCVATREDGTTIAKSEEVSVLRTAIKDVVQELNGPPAKSAVK